MSTIVLTNEEWKVIRVRIAAVHGRTMIMIQAKMKRELGFTVRDHCHGKDNEWKYDTRLDFYDESLELIFRLTYM